MHVCNYTGGGGHFFLQKAILCGVHYNVHVTPFYTLYVGGGFMSFLLVKKGSLVYTWNFHFTLARCFLSILTP